MDGKEITEKVYERLRSLPLFVPGDLDSVFNRAEAYASAIRLYEQIDFENWVVRDERYTSSPGFAMMPLKTPPVKNGMMDCFEKLDAILVPKDRGSVSSPGQLVQVRPSRVFRPIRSLYGIARLISGPYSL